MTDWNKIEETLKNIVEEMGGNADQINNGDCAVFAKKAYNALTEMGVEVEIVNNLSDEMQDELEGYETIEAEYSEGISHCYLLIDGWFFDAYDVDGVENEEELQYHVKCL
ncbi:MAG: hypothetical protein ACFFD1_00770 [Candidatus Thorarchaeota archaeon]